MKIYNTTVFAYNNKGGNPCPVVLEADKLTYDDMIGIAQKMKLEVGFVLNSNNSSYEYEFKYFVPNKEMEMCVHATIACVTVLKEQKFLDKNKFSVGTLAGVIEIEIVGDDSDFKVKVKQGKPEISNQYIDKLEIANALNISVNQLSDSLVKNVSTSRFKTIIELKDLEKLNELKPNYDYLWEVCDKIGSTGLYPFVKDENNIYHARQFPNNTGYFEDSATGVAASALGIYVRDVINQSFDELKVYQGFAMGSPSEIVVINNEKSNFVVGRAVIE
ncbi:PhzF family phenazine biosynthesis protein [Macrococcus equipercicus]|uniref:PhzF family phenazine biosynthesis isomerase n=1 Tax=Macrococcus equipercicus TaxID=69967 RepID=A0A9Q9BSW9_9STAP|nr:PhzF family phenazine biosynthesis isomerase [Macrococcus equipercicus]KAA1039382.1 PhzF family phenazine biosynthesis isomerase [Macrococcus equipercicus]UTH13674.1 PhzF family phenazine biosynthesis isomerase [Macrococcus equipercicus]